MRTDRFHKQVRRTQNNQGLQWAREQEDLQQGSSRTQRSSRKAAHHQYPLLQCIYLQEEEKKNHDRSRTIYQLSRGRKQKQTLCGKKKLVTRFQVWRGACRDIPGDIRRWTERRQRQRKAIAKLYSGTPCEFFCMNWTNLFSVNTSYCLPKLLHKPFTGKWPTG